MAQEKSYPVSEHFDVREFLHPSVFAALGWPKCLWVLDKRMWAYTELLRSIVDAPVYVNDWHRGGERVGRGHRPRSYKPDGGGELSQHYLARAVDTSVKGMTADQLHRLILDHQDLFLAIGITTLENIKLTPTWVHADWRPSVPGVHKPGELLIVG